MTTNMIKECEKVSFLSSCFYDIFCYFIYYIISESFENNLFLYALLSFCLIKFLLIYFQEIQNKLDRLKEFQGALQNALIALKKVKSFLLYFRYIPID